MSNNVTAPYARAAAHINAGGNLVRGKNITSVSRPETGKYIITVATTIKASESVVLASIDRSGAWGTEALAGIPGNPPDDHTFIVWTGKDGGASNQPFHFMVP
ncbi:hypothetical protein AB0I99_19450 [Streptomyces spongiicola]|uniref:Bacterial Ig domain-containing protein n=2 Tax=Streptomyces spongiicola TaxID=1690221 RepID=A0ABN5KF90_9ACTN|nr:hypothetical protein DDQ41_03655 [Streptomyces spongiicola]